METTSLSVGDLLDRFVAVAEELIRREVTRSTNNPLADLAELYFERALKLKRAPKSTKGYDATDAEGRRYEIKGRRLTASNTSRALSAIRAISASHFDYLAGVLFNDNMTVMKACLVPRAVVTERARYVGHTNSHRFVLSDDVWALPGVKDVTSELREAESAIRAMR